MTSIISYFKFFSQTLGCKKWDTAAPEAILEAVGGTLTNIKGEHYSYAHDVEHVNKCGVLATTKEISHEQLVTAIPDHVKEVLSSNK